MDGIGRSHLAEDEDEYEDDNNEIFARYRVVEKLGEGAYGRVYKVQDRKTSVFCALKKMRIHYEDDGLPGTAIREVSLLRECDHPNVIKLIDVFSTCTDLCLVFEHLDMDLRNYLKGYGATFQDPACLKRAAYQCISGIDFCHRHRILHRDLKPQNVLVNARDLTMKIADFGLARAYSVPLRTYTREVVTLWYRAPEILLGQPKYATPIDIWSLACIVAEMATWAPLFPGDSEIDTIFKIFQVLGTPTEDMWPGVTTLLHMKPSFPRWASTDLAEVQRHGPGLGPSGIDLLQRCFKYNSAERLPAHRLLLHQFFSDVDVEN